MDAAHSNQPAIFSGGFEKLSNHSRAMRTKVLFLCGLGLVLAACLIWLRPRYSNETERQQAKVAGAEAAVESQRAQDHASESRLPLDSSKTPVAPSEVESAPSLLVISNVP